MFPCVNSELSDTSAHRANAGGGGRGTMDMCACVCVCVPELTATPLLDCADELKPRPAVSEGISPLNDTKLQGSTSAQHIHCCLCRLNWIAFGLNGGGGRGELRCDRFGIQPMNSNENKQKVGILSIKFCIS